MVESVAAMLGAQDAERVGASCATVRCSELFEPNSLAAPLVGPSMPAHRQDFGLV